MCLLSHHWGMTYGSCENGLEMAHGLQLEVRYEVKLKKLLAYN